MRLSSIRVGMTHILLPVTLILMTCRDATAVTNCFGASRDDSVWATIERIGSEQLIGMVLLVGLAVALAIISLRRFRGVAAAVRESRAYESRVLTSLYYNRVDEAINAVESFPSSPVAAVVSASLQWSKSHWKWTESLSRLSAALRILQNGREMRGACLCQLQPKSEASALGLSS
jgi:hypothetical protein